MNFICRSFGTLVSIFIPIRLWRWNRVFRNVDI